MYPSVLPSLFEDCENIAVTEPIRSPLNYIGGKFKLLPQLLTLFPPKINTFVDLFCGGCNVGVNIDARHIIFNDNLVYLIDLYKVMQQQNTTEIINHIEKRIAEFDLSLTNAEGYNRLRDLYNTDRIALDLFVLIAYSFNHQIRFNRSHKFNNPFGRQRSSFNHKMRKNLELFIKRLHSISCEFTSENFDEIDLSTLCKGDFIYCDPPYLITTGTYNDGKRGFTGWSEAEESCLLSLLDSLDTRGIKFALSNVLTHKGQYNTTLQKWINSKGYIVKHLTMNYANSNYQTIDRNINSSDEILVLNYTPQCDI
ncbi:MAG: DNA adenine methylase [Bacteroides sp.]|nr:DNA adenine methylase [Bacteroides sp.]